jgi:hypothetical protein
MIPAPILLVIAMALLAEPKLAEWFLCAYAVLWILTQRR